MMNDAKMKLRRGIEISVGVLSGWYWRAGSKILIGEIRNTTGGADKINTNIESQQVHLRTKYSSPYTRLYDHLSGFYSRNNGSENQQ